jgi:hypothetical protein
MQAIIEHMFYTNTRSPVNLLRNVSGTLPNEDWVRNVLAAGGCELITRGRRYQLADPEIFHDQSRRPAPAIARPILRAIGAADFMRLRQEGDGEADRR